MEKFEKDVYVKRSGCIYKIESIEQEQNHFSPFTLRYNLKLVAGQTHIPFRNNEIGFASHHIFSEIVQTEYLQVDVLKETLGECFKKMSYEIININDYEIYQIEVEEIEGL
jgi:hypothetical protein